MSPINRLEKCLADARQGGAKVLAAYTMAGIPSPAKSPEIILSMIRGGADIIEIGVPFSDPVADGPVIQEAGTRALAGGVNLPQVFQLLRQVRQEPEAREVPLVLMVYYNNIYRYGMEDFLREAAASGADGLIVPDLPLEESGPLEEAAAGHQLILIRLIAPTTNGQRLDKIASQARGFIYFVSVTGVTGVRTQVNQEIGTHLARIRELTSTPVLIGFGISTPEQARHLAPLSDGIIVGSALVKKINDLPPEQSPGEVAQLISQLKEAMN